jgi:hypothetical protein
VSLNLDAMLKFDGESRTVLIDRIGVLVAELRARIDLEERARTKLVIEGCLTCKGGESYKAMLENLGHVQARCTELLTETRILKTALELLEMYSDVHPDGVENCIAEAREIWRKP